MLSNSQKQELTQIIGVVVIVGLVMVVVVGLVYGVMGNFDPGTLQWIATFAVLGVIVSFVAGWKVAAGRAREHLRGFDRGVDGAEKTIQAIGRGLSATASMARAAKSQPVPTPAARFDELLPRPKGGAAITIRKPEDDEIIL